MTRLSSKRHEGFILTQWLEKLKAEAHTAFEAHGLPTRRVEAWKYSDPKNDMYQQEHNELFASIRAGTARGGRVAARQDAREPRLERRHHAPCCEPLGGRHRVEIGLAQLLAVRPAEMSVDFDPLTRRLGRRALPGLGQQRLRETAADGCRRLDLCAGRAGRRQQEPQHLIEEVRIECVLATDAVTALRPACVDAMTSMLLPEPSARRPITCRSSSSRARRSSSRCSGTCLPSSRI